MIAITYDGALAEDIRILRDKLRDAEKKFDEDTQSRNNIKKGAILRNPDTGFMYRVHSFGFRVGLNRGVQYFVRTHRVYSTKRVAAASTTIFSSGFNKLELIEENQHGS